MAKAKKGQIVQTKVDPRTNGGDDVAAALVTKVDEDNEVVNLRVFLDSGADLKVNNVAVRASQPDEDADDVETDASNVQRVCWTR